MDKNDINTWMNKIQKAESQKKLNIQVMLLYIPNGEDEKVENLVKSEFDVDENIRDSMLNRLKHTYTAHKLKNYSFEAFNIIANNEKTFYFCQKTKFSNLKTGLDRLVNSSPTKSFDKDDLKNVLAAVVEFNYDNSSSYAFVGVNNFNSLVNSKLGFFGNVSKNEITKLADDNLLLGITDKVAFVYFDNGFIVNPKGKSAFTRIFFLRDEYQKIGEKVSKNLVGYKDRLMNVEKLYDDLYGKGSKHIRIADQMLAKLNDDKRKNELKDLLGDKDLFKKRLTKIENFKNEKQFKGKFKDLNIDVANAQIEYTKDALFPFLAVLSDRPKETILLNEKELGS